MVKLLIIADDFTGALDTAIQFVSEGINTQVFTGSKIQKDCIEQDTQVLVVDSETRPMSPKEAYQTVYRIVKQAIDLGISIVYKKTDSALRGNIGSELAAVVDATEEKRIYFIPAYPQMNRITRKGIHYINGEPLEKSSFKDDPFNPMDISYVPEIIARQTEIPVVRIEQEEEIPLLKKGREILVADAQTQEDIEKRAEEIEEKRELKLLAGCAGFASVLPKILGLSGNYQQEIIKTKSFFVACGSLNSITKEQVEYAQEHGFCRKNLKPQQKLNSQYYETQDGEEFLDELERICEKEKYVLVDSFDLEGEESTLDYVKRTGYDRDFIRFSISACHGKIVRKLLERNVNLTILMTGGDTLMGFMKEIGSSSLIPVREIEKGSVLSKLIWNGKEIQVISKSGGFGQKDVFVKIAEQVVKK